MGQNLRMSWTSVLLLTLAFGLCQSQYGDYGPPPDYVGGPGGDFGSGDYGSGSGSATTITPVATTKAPTVTTKKPTVTTKAPTTSKPSGKTVVFPKLKSPIAGYKYTKVFGVSVFAHTSVSDAKFQHVASIMAEWLDNDEDGCVDTPVILKYLADKNDPSYAVVKSNNAKDDWMVPFMKKNFVCSAPQEEWETVPKCTGLKGTNQCSDSTLEEVWHVIQGQGYAPAFKQYFSTGTMDDVKTKFKNVNSTLATLLDAARGGIPRSPSVPKGGKFPAKAYYTYNDTTCKFPCQAIEYWWWSTAAYTGLIKNRSEVKKEFKYYLPEDFKAKDPKMYALITDTTKGYKLPNRPPNGKYTGKKTCASGANVI